MMATSNQKLEQEPGEIEMLLPWHAAGTLNPRDARRVDEALARDPDLARQFEVIKQEYAETIHLNESLGAPPVRVMQKLFTAIDQEPARAPSLNFSAGITGFFAGLSPRTLAWSAGLAALALLFQAGLIGAVLMKNQDAMFQTASLSSGDRTVPAANLPRAMVRFSPEARMADITALLDAYQGSIIEGSKGVFFRLQFGNKAISADEFANLLSRLQSEKIVSLAVATP